MVELHYPLKPIYYDSRRTHTACGISLEGKATGEIKKMAPTNWSLTTCAGCLEWKRLRDIEKFTASIQIRYQRIEGTRKEIERYKTKILALGGTVNDAPR